MRLALGAALLLALAPLLRAQAPAPGGEEALRARLPADCGKRKAPDRPKIHRKDVPPTAKSLAESYGLLTGPLADFLEAAGDVDLVFDTDLCERREWDDEASGVELEVTESLLCGEVIEVELRHRAPVDPLAGLLDAGVAEVLYRASDGTAVAVAGAELRDILHLLRTRSRNNGVETATRPRRGSGGRLVPCEVSRSEFQGGDGAGLEVRLRDRTSRFFPGHARSGEFAGFTNTDLYPALERLARTTGQPPPKE